MNTPKSISATPTGATHWYYGTHGDQTFVRHNVSENPCALALVWSNISNKWIVNPYDIKNRDLGDVEIYTVIQPVMYSVIINSGMANIVFTTDRGAYIASTSYPLRALPNGEPDHRIAEYMALVLSNAAPF